MFKINKFLIILISVLILASCYNQSIQRPIPIDNGNSQTGKIETNSGIDEKSISNITSESNTGSEKKQDKIISYNGINKTDLSLKVTDDFTISIFADNLDGARDLVGPDKMGNYYLSRTSKGVITMLGVKDSKVISKNEIVKNLNNPHGLAIDPEDGMTLYFAETNKLSKIRLYSDGKIEKIIDLPNGGRHFTRSLLFGSDSKLYVSIGSTCDTCYEKDQRVASIYRLDKDGQNLEKVASGLRNSVFMDLNPINGEIWATEMGRDNLGDNIPPDEINIIKKGNDYGWPICYGNNIHDSKFDTRTYIANPCMNKIPAHIEMQAHSAPLGISFIPEDGWPEYYRNSILVAYHGSWNRSKDTGYKIVNFKLNDLGNIIEQRDFITGFINDKNIIFGRPVDILTQTGGITFITDDKKGVIYKINYNK